MQRVVNIRKNYIISVIIFLGVVIANSSLIANASTYANTTNVPAKTPKTNSDQYKDIVKNLEKVFKQEISNVPEVKKQEYKNIIKDLVTKSQVKAKDKADILKIQNKTNEILFDKQKELQSSLKDSNDNGCPYSADVKIDENNSSQDNSILIFVSTSMNKRLLVKLAKEASRYGGQLVMRGFLDNSYIKTAAFLKNVMDESGEGISIDPMLFKTYAVTAVPTYIVTKSSCIGEKECIPLHDKLSGNVSLQYAISEIREKGEVFQDKSSKEQIERRKS